MRVRISAIGALLGLTAAGASGASDLPGFLAQARSADVVILGEIHDNPTHHATQAEIVAALDPSALVFEMFPQGAEAEINDLRAKGAPPAEIARALDWPAGGWPDFGYYAAILAAAPGASVFGAGQPPADTARAASEGAAAAFGRDATRYGLDRPLAPADLAARQRRFAEAHCGRIPAARLPGMIEAQRFRDAGLADAAIWARIMTGGGQVVVIAGSGHADKRRGAPVAITAADPELRVVTLGQFEAPPDADEHFDGVILAPAPARPDPCAALP